MKKIINEVLENGKIVTKKDFSEQYVEFLYTSNDKFHEFFGMVFFRDRELRNMD